MKREKIIERRRAPFTAEEAKFSTQRTITYILLAVFSTVTFIVLHQADQSERSMIIQTVINLTLLAAGYWLGASKSAADSRAESARPALPATRPTP